MRRAGLRGPLWRGQHSNRSEQGQRGTAAQSVTLAPAVSLAVAVGGGYVCQRVWVSSTASCVCWPAVSCTHVGYSPPPIPSPPHRFAWWGIQDDPFGQRIVCGVCPECRLAWHGHLHLLHGTRDCGKCSGRGEGTRAAPPQAHADCALLFVKQVIVCARSEFLPSSCFDVACVLLWSLACLQVHVRKCRLSCANEQFDDIPKYVNGV